MKHNAGNRRSRNRGGGKRQGGGGGRNNFESNGPEVKVRGTAQQVLEKYLALGRDAASAGDRIKSESYFQFAEHYYRIANADGALSNNQGNNQGNNQSGGQNRNESRQQNQDASKADGSGPQPVVADSDAADKPTPPADEAEVISTATAVESTDNADASADSGDDVEADKIDESVLPAAVPTAPSPAPAPRRRRRAKADKEAAPEVA